MKNKEDLFNLFKDLGTTPEEFEREALEALQELQSQGELTNIDYEYEKEHFWE